MPTLVANVLAGEVVMTIGRGLSLEHGLTLRDQWREGAVNVGVLQNWIPICPQLLDPNPVVVANEQFRRALTHAMDRQQMADDIRAGLVPVSDSIIAPTQPEYRAVEPYRRQGPRHAADGRGAPVAPRVEPAQDRGDTQWPPAIILV